MTSLLMAFLLLIPFAVLFIGVAIGASFMADFEDLDLGDDDDDDLLTPDPTLSDDAYTHSWEPRP